VTELAGPFEMKLPGDGTLSPDHARLLMRRENWSFEAWREPATSSADTPRTAARLKSVSRLPPARHFSRLQFAIPNSTTLGVRVSIGEIVAPERMTIAGRRG